MEVVVPAADGRKLLDRAGGFLVAILGVVIVGCLVLLALGLGRSGAEDEADDRETREAVMAQADQFVLRLNTYGPGDLDADLKLPAYADRVREVISTKLQVEFDKNLNLAEQTVSQTGYARKAEVFATGVESADADSAAVLVVGAITSSYPDTNAESGRFEYPAQPFRWHVDLVKVDGAWRVDNWAPLTGEAEDPAATQPPVSGAPTPGASGPASSAPASTGPAAPSPGPTSSGAGQ